MSSYVVLARKWRSAQFSDIVGQGHIVRTLMNAIRAQRIHQAYLFTGSRGIGKTSIARIFAKVIRCEQTRLEGEWLRSCDECASCREITSGNGIDVIEIDGASNNGVEAVREIRENAKFLPSTGSRKIYIIDEVHMLTTAAFNALLKTLEEPPAHVIFIFATTEPHKIPATILSRCQRFDYRRHTVAQIQSRLSDICKTEGIASDPGALALVARAGEGSMRDALSLLDQVIAFSGSQLSVQAVRESIGLVEGQTLLAILSGVFARKPLDALEQVEQAHARGHDLKVLTRSLIEFLHAAVLAKIGAPTPSGLELSEEEWAELRKVADLRSLEEIELIFQVLHHGLDWISRSPQPKVVLDILLVKCATAEALVSVSAAAGSQPAPAKTPSPSSAIRPASPQAVQAKPAVQTPVTPPSEARTAAPPAEAPASSQLHEAPAAAASAGGPASWEGFIEKVRQTRPLLATLLEHGNCLGLPSATEAPGSGDLVIGIQPKDTYFKEQLQAKAYQEQLLSLSKEYFGRHVRVVVEIRDGGESLAARKERELTERQLKARAAVQNHPIIQEAKALFGGELGPIELNDAEN